MVIFYCRFPINFVPEMLKSGLSSYYNRRTIDNLKYIQRYLKTTFDL